ncbi:MAG: FAD:protein FMN transferase, partial [Lachnospiraceae bacterium]|nr:FAD:protein FMN transferase [Lachnospiraceae bacterium]
MHSVKSVRFFVSVLIPAVCCALCLNSCAEISNTNPVSRTGFAFDTIISITIYDNNKSDVLDACFDLCETYESLFSATREDSEVWKINHSDGSPVPVSFETASLIQSALLWCEKSNGALDLTMLPIEEEWCISEQMTRMSENPDYEYYIPNASELNKLLEHVNYRNVVIYNENGKTVTYDEELSDEHSYRVQLSDAEAGIDLGFIAKGYIADKLKEFMLSQGIESGVISLGGNVLLIGEKPDHSPFNIGIQKPFGNAGEIITMVQKTDTSVVSSGCYERYFSDSTDGRIYHHIFDT